MTDAIAATTAESDQTQIVAMVGSMSFCRSELETLFNRVANRENWKLPVNSIVDVKDDRELTGLREAVIFFTGSVPKFEPRSGGSLPGCRYRITAPGYYAAVGA